MPKVHAQVLGPPLKTSGPSNSVVPRVSSQLESARPPELLALSRRSSDRRTSPRLLLTLAWFSTAFVPWLMQIKSYYQLATPHKVAQNIIVQSDAEQLTQDLAMHCPVEELKIAAAFWNINPTHYFVSPRQEGVICAFVIQQYNVFGHYHIHNYSITADQRSNDTDKSYIGEEFTINYYFYHGSIGYYSYYEEGVGIYYTEDHTGHVVVGKLGSFDINGQVLADDRGGSVNEYRQSYYYQIVEALWIVFRALVVRRSWAACQRYGRQCKTLGEELTMANAIVFAQEGSRLTAHHANNFQRVIMIYFLVESLMADLFFLIAKDGLFAKLQYVSLGYNLAGVISVAFEIIEARKCLSSRRLRVIKRTLFNFETALLGEFACATLIHHYLTLLNRSDIKRSIPAAKAVSFYIWGLVGHFLIVVWLLGVIFATRIIVSLTVVLIKHGSLRMLAEPCSVDTLLGIKQKTAILTGYTWHQGRLLYSVRALKSYGLIRSTDWERTEFLVHYRVDWFVLPKRRSVEVIGRLRGATLQRCEPGDAVNVEVSPGTITMCEYAIGAAPGP